MSNDIQKELDTQMQEGYKLSMAGNEEAASRIWMQLWDKIKTSMDELDLKYIEDMDRIFQGTQSIFNWASDFEMELENAARRNKELVQNRIRFCNEYVARSKDKGGLNILNMRRAVAEALFQLGRGLEGEQLFKEILEEYPTYGWGWIGWSDQYGLFAQNQDKNSEKAISILKQALGVENLEDRLDVLDRLNAIYTELGMTQEAAEVRQMILDQENKNRSNRFASISPSTVKSIPVANVKVGRNDPCPCGSGKKYKKCCGK
ncbi:SEC-C metal-binding domain-containing protein [Paenibacillaceae bacterium T2]|uniref:SEC-C metal-binding domain-containing protein n=2 Tax=Ferviditalea candida TaxID=3108399 RepID=A0ABU5ZQ02_9BACL|nr:SEC-C metal-binding domain-containing protein [Paenibacillaceae bacterium T2]